MLDRYENLLKISNISPRFRKHLVKNGFSIRDEQNDWDLPTDIQRECANALKDGSCSFISAWLPPFEAITKLGMIFPELDIDLHSLQIDKRYASSLFLGGGMEEGILMEFVGGTKKELVKFMMDEMGYDKKEATNLLK